MHAVIFFLHGGKPQPCIIVVLNAGEQNSSVYPFIIIQSAKIILCALVACKITGQQNYNILHFETKETTIWGSLSYLEHPLHGIAVEMCTG